MKYLLVLFLLFAGVPPGQARAVQSQPIAPPSVAQMATKAKAENAKARSQDVPMFTNDNLPTGPGGISVIGPSSEGNAASGATGREENVKANQDVAKLRYQLAQAREELQLHQGELSVLQQRLGQKNLQYYPDPYKTAMQEFTRSDIEKLTNDIGQKRDQVAADQRTVQELEGAVQSAETQSGWMQEAGSGTNGALSEPPIAAKPGTAAYWQARLDAAKNQLSLAQEKTDLAKNQLDLLKTQQIQTLNPNLQAELTGAISSKQDEISSDESSIRQAQTEVRAAQEMLLKLSKAKQ